nr:cold shock domain-containing protein [Krasilnikovia cinnamomea]
MCLPSPGQSPACPAVRVIVGSHRPAPADRVRRGRSVGENQSVEFEVTQGPRRPQAASIRPF